MLAWRNLLHDKIRFAVTIIGIVFSVVLTAVQLGLFFGFMQATSELIAHSEADLWVVSKGVSHLEMPVAMPESRYFQTLAVPGVARAEKILIGFGNWKKPNGAEEGPLIVGFNLDAPLGWPWSFTRGTLAELHRPDSVVVDELYRDKLGVTQLNQTVEMRGRRVRVVGFTKGIRTFTTAPIVFTSFKNAQRYYGLAENQMMFVLVQATRGANLQAVQRELQARVPEVDVYTRDEFIRKQSFYWLFGTGAGVTVLIAAFLGLLVGVVIVAQTIYASTVDHLREFGTLKAMGASNGYLYRVIIRQSLISGVIGFALGISISLALSQASQQSITLLLLDGTLVVTLFGLTMLMCAVAAIVSINKVTRLDPALVFKG